MQARNRRKRTNYALFTGQPLAGALLRLPATVNMVHMGPRFFTSSETLRRAPAREGVRSAHWTALMGIFGQRLRAWGDEDGLRGGTSVLPVWGRLGVTSDALANAERARCPFHFERLTADGFHDGSLLFGRPSTPPHVRAHVSAFRLKREVKGTCVHC